MRRPFVVVVASEKGGVGKTTIATNLAVYLKALREDLPVTIGSFDNHFSVDQMFALGPRPNSSIAALMDDEPAEDLAVLGQYGVQYMASSRRLQAPSHAPGWLRQRLHAIDLPGILILDTRPILDWFTEAALLSADLVLTPVKDRAALINASALHQVLNDVERTGRLWLLPSLVDSRARLNSEVRVHEYLIYAARERDYQVLDFCVSKSPKVESLASGFSSAIKPVLTHARNTAVHGQLKQLADFVLNLFENESSSWCAGEIGLQPDSLDALPAIRRRNLVLECPACCQQSIVEGGCFYFDLRSRRRGFLHAGCFEELREIFNLNDDDNLIALTIDGPGLVSHECRLTVHVFDVGGELLGSEEVDLDGRASLGPLLAMMTGRPLDMAYRELILVSGDVQTAKAQLSDAVYRGFVQQRRQVARELREGGLF